MKQIAQNLPVVYQLLPSQKYIANAGAYLFRTVYSLLGKTELAITGDNLKTWFSAKGFNALAYDQADNLHSSNARSLPEGVKAYSFVNCDKPTLSAINDICRAPAAYRSRSVRLVLPASACAKIPKFNVLIKRHAP